MESTEMKGNEEAQTGSDMLSVALKSSFGEPIRRMMMDDDLAI